MIGFSESPHTQVGCNPPARWKQTGGAAFQISVPIRSLKFRLGLTGDFTTPVSSQTRERSNQHWKFNLPLACCDVKTRAMYHFRSSIRIFNSSLVQVVSIASTGVTAKIAFNPETVPVDLLPRKLCAVSELGQSIVSFFKSFE